MIVVNGYIEPVMKTGGGIDDNGNPAQPVKSTGQPIPCRIKISKHNSMEHPSPNYINISNGNTFNISSYEVLIRRQEFDANIIKLTLFKKNLGEYSVISAEILEAADAIKILV
jgi:hypothetical protein